MGNRLQQSEKSQVSEKLKSLLATTQQTALQVRVEESISKSAVDQEQKLKEMGPSSSSSLLEK